MPNCKWLHMMPACVECIFANVFHNGVAARDREGGLGRRDRTPPSIICRVWLLNGEKLSQHNLCSTNRQLFSASKRAEDYFRVVFGGKDAVKLNQKSGKSIPKHKNVVYVHIAFVTIRIPEACRGWCADKSATIWGWMQRVRHLKRWKLEFAIEARGCCKSRLVHLDILQAPLQKPYFGGALEWPGGPGAPFHEAGLSPIATSHITIIVTLKKNLRSGISRVHSAPDEISAGCSDLPKRKAKTKSIHSRNLFNLVLVTCSRPLNLVQYFLMFLALTTSNAWSKFWLEAAGNRSVVM